MKTVRIGIFGYFRGAAYADHILANNGQIVAVCDKNEERLQEAKDKLGDMVTCYKSFDEFLNHDMDAVLITNFFHEHAEYSIRCMEKNIHVLSECTSNSTMAEGVRLVEAAQNSKAIYMLAENYPFMLINQEIKRVYDGGTLGKCLYAEGEYNHAANPYGKTSAYGRSLYDGSSKHWRAHLPATYYVTHSLAPLMHATGANPVRVTAMPVFDPSPADSTTATYIGDKAAIITTLNNDDSVFKFTGHALYGSAGNSYRLCCRNGQIENVRGSGGKIMLRYNSWNKPEDMEITNFYKPEWTGPDAELIKKAGHDGGDFCVIREFFRCIREGKEAPFDVYFATRMASVAILGHRSLMERGVPYDIPDFRLEADREKYRNDELSPFYYSDGREPTISCCSHADYRPSQQQEENFDRFLKGE